MDVSAVVARFHKTVDDVGRSRLIFFALAASLVCLIFFKILQQPQLRPRRVSFIEPVRDFDWRSEKPKQLRPLKSVYHITMGLQTDVPDNLITIDRDYLSRIVKRKEILAQYGSHTHGVTPQGVEAVHELYRYLVARYLPSRYPSIFQVREKQMHNTATGQSFPLAADTDPEECLRVLGQTVEEDMFLLRPTEEGHECIAFVCCFPSGFNPSTKLGLVLNKIHQDVPSYDKIGPSMERFFSRVKVGENVKRMNWSMQTHEELFSCLENEAVRRSRAEEQLDMSKTFLRVELQTLSRLPKTKALLFSFKTYLYPVEEIKAQGEGPRLADAIEGLRKGNAKKTWEYKRANHWAGPVCEYLRN